MVECSPSSARPKRERSPVCPEDDGERVPKRPYTLDTTLLPVRTSPQPQPNALPSPPSLLGTNPFHIVTPSPPPPWTPPRVPTTTPTTITTNFTSTPSGFEAAAKKGAEEARQHSANSGEFFTLGLNIVRQARLSAAQRRSSRILPGGGDTTTAACYALGGTADSTLTILASAVSPTQPRDSRLKAVERALKRGIRASIVRLNGGDASRDVRASNLAAVRICTSVADILAAYSAQCLVADLERARAESEVKDATIAGLREQLRRGCGCGKGRS